MYAIHEYVKFRDNFRKLMPDIPFQDLYDSWMTVLFERICIDPLLLGRRLEQMYPDEYEYMSICEIINKHYGDEAEKLIEEVL